jgi:hypothetical protein
MIWNLVAQKQARKSRFMCLCVFVDFCDKNKHINKRKRDFRGFMYICVFVSSKVI